MADYNTRTEIEKFACERVSPTIERVVPYEKGTRMTSNQNAIGIEDNIAQEISFHKELDGRFFERADGAMVLFSDIQSILNLFHQQCPNWKQQGITSVPMARRPHFLLRGKQMTRELEKKMKPNLKGDDAEKQLYGFFIEEFSFSRPGMIVIPNFTTAGRFATEGTNVEIDMIVIHPDCGVFLFNVKNQGIKVKTPVNAMREGLRRHTRFVRMLQAYKAYDSPTSVAIHSVICDFVNEKSTYRRLENEPNDINRLFILEKNVLCQDEFGSSWRNILKGFPAHTCANGYPIGTFI